MTWPEFVAVKPLWWRLILLGAAAYFGIYLLLFFAQRKLIYFPLKYRFELPPGFEEVSSPRGEVIGFKRVNNLPRCLFFFHGNGGNASLWSQAVVDFPGDVFVLEYPGYGGRGGRPSERSIKGAAQELFDSEHRRYETVIVGGQSLGAGVTAGIIEKFPGEVDLLVLITPFISLTEMARDQFAFFPTGWILRDKMELYQAWLAFQGPSVVVTAENDEIIPRRHGLRYEAQRSATRRMIEIPGTSHNTLNLDSGLWERILNAE